MRTHLFVAPSSAAFGEMLLGLRLARELHARGDRVIFLAASAQRMLLRDTPFEHGAIDGVNSVLDRALPDVIRKRRCDTVVLVDMLLVLLVLARERIDPAFLDHLGVPTFALDFWDLRRSDLRLDMCEEEMLLSSHAHTAVPNRLVPVPFARPDTANAYCALPEPSMIDDRAATRAELGIEDGARLVMFTTARFQTRARTPFQARAVATVPQEILRTCLACDPRVRVVHVGPSPVLEGVDRYVHLMQVPPARFEQLVRASDLLLTANQPATGIATALALGTPALAVIGQTTEFRFRLFPLGLYSFLEPALAHNPYADVVPAVDLAQLPESIEAAIFDDALRAARIRAARAYVDMVRRLPAGADLVTPS